ncbi:MAG TPA: Wzz/FepE/Etk N-terminal domain-containing protein [Geminicoccaceae bacterium]
MQSEKREPELAVVVPAASIPPDVRRAAGAQEITLAGLWSTFWRGWWIVLAVTLATLLLSAAYLKLRTPVYTASMVVAPAERDLAAAGRLAAELEQYASLATLAQTPVKLEQVSTIDRYVQLLGSVRLAERLESEHQIMRQTFQDQWDESRGSWQPPEGLVPGTRFAILEFFGFPGWTPPDLTQLAEYLSGRIMVSRYGGTALRQLRAEHPDGAFAASLIDLAHRAADDLLREDALARVRADIASLEDALEETRDEPVRREALEATLGERYQIEALLTSGQPYAAEVLSPAQPSSAPSSTSPLIVLTLALLVGLILGVFVVFLRDALRRGLA